MRGLHVIIAKPAVMKLEHHVELVRLAEEKGVLVCVEMHKRWDPIYMDATTRIRQGILGGFSYCASYMSQPKKQLRTFGAWAGKSSDISYYLNAHHVDFLANAVQGFARPTRVTAMASTGVANDMGIPAEDTITVSVQWEDVGTGALGHSVHTSSWIAPPADVHSQQRFFYLGTKGEANVDQAHRGYTTSTDAAGFTSNNPLFMKYTPDEEGRFAGQQGYGYQSISLFIEGAQRLAQSVPLAAVARGLASMSSPASHFVTAIIEAGRISLDEKGRSVAIVDYKGSVPGRLV